MASLFPSWLTHGESLQNLSLPKDLLRPGEDLLYHMPNTLMPMAVTAWEVASRDCILLTTARILTLAKGAVKTECDLSQVGAANAVPGKAIGWANVRITLVSDSSVDVGCATMEAAEWFAGRVVALVEGQVLGSERVGRSVGERLRDGYALDPGTHLSSPNRNFCAFVEAGNLLVWDTRQHHETWRSGGGAKPKPSALRMCFAPMNLEAAGSSGSCRLRLQKDGQLHIVGENDVIRWTAGIQARPKEFAPWHLSMQDDGDLVLYDFQGTPVWRTGTGVSSVESKEEEGKESQRHIMAFVAGGTGSLHAFEAALKEAKPEDKLTVVCVAELISYVTCGQSVRFYTAEFMQSRNETLKLGAATRLNKALAFVNSLKEMGVETIPEVKYKRLLAEFHTPREVAVHYAQFEKATHLFVPSSPKGVLDRLSDLVTYDFGDYVAAQCAKAHVTCVVPEKPEFDEAASPAEAVAGAIPEGVKADAAEGKSVQAPKVDACCSSQSCTSQS
mmetsp:Transcript_22019/g.24473  ORF Transcript_22019/g.24473 Transcript_22019/m.24473 type:complete len:502 (+) Transcript_22019:36-1541(+)